MCSLHSYSVKVPDEKREALVLFPASLLLTLLWEPIQMPVPAYLHNVHSNYVHRHYLMSHLSQSEEQLADMTLP